MRIRNFLTSRRRAMFGITMLALMFSTLMSNFAFASKPMSGNTEDAIVQVACAEPNEVPVPFTINYQNGPAWDRDVMFGNTTQCPPDGGDIGFDGAVMPGVEGSGNVDGITINGISVKADGATVDIPVNEGGGQSLRFMRVYVYHYGGRLYIVIVFRW